MERAMVYPPITDWSREGRRRFLGAHRDVAACLLDVAFGRVEEDGYDLRAFGFKGEDPVTEAVTWSLGRFADGEFDPSRLAAEKCTLRLFTEGWFWLAQRVGRRALPEVKARARRVHPGLDPSSWAALEEDSDDSGGADDARIDRLALTLRALSSRACPPLVTYWLEAAEKFRAALFRDDPGELAAVLALLPEAAPSQHSKRTADALFRYLALYLGLVDVEGAGPSHRACVLSWFSGCDDRPPYERSQELVLHDLGDCPPRELSTLRHFGVEDLIRRCVGVARPAGEGDPAFARWSLRKTLLGVFHITDARVREDLAAIRERGR